MGKVGTICLAGGPVGRESVVMAVVAALSPSVLFCAVIESEGAAMTGTAWVVVANGSKAVIYQWPGLNDPLTEIECVLNPENRMQNRELATGSIGQSIAGRAGLAPRILPKEHVRDEFARRVAQGLNDARKNGSYDELVVVSSNPFLGELLAQLTPEARELLAVSYPIDVTALPRLELQNWLRKRRKPGYAD